MSFWTDMGVNCINGHSHTWWRRVMHPMQRDWERVALVIAPFDTCDTLLLLSSQREMPWHPWEPRHSHSVFWLHYSPSLTKAQLKHGNVGPNCFWQLCCNIGPPIRGAAWREMAGTLSGVTEDCVQDHWRITNSAGNAEVMEAFICISWVGKQSVITNGHWRRILKHILLQLVNAICLWQPSKLTSSLPPKWSNPFGCNVQSRQLFLCSAKMCATCFS